MEVLWLGCGAGWGHAVRCAAIARHMKAEVVAVCDASVPLDYVGIPHITRDQLHNVKPKVIVWDQFQEIYIPTFFKRLVRLDCPKVLLQKQLTPSKPKPFNVYPDLVLDVEQNVLFRSWWELPSFEEARDRLGVSVDDNVALIVREDAEVKYAQGWTYKYARYESFPLMDVLPGVDHVFGFAGCNLVAECVATGTPASFTAHPFTADQEHRAKQWAFRGFEKRLPVPEYTNNAPVYAGLIDLL